MELQFRALLTSSAAITALVPAARINFGTNRQGAGYPAIVLNTISDIEGIHMNGPDRFYEGRVQVDVYGGTYKAVKDISKAVRTLLHGYRSTNFRLIMSVSARDSREGGSNEADRPYRVSMDFTTAWRA